jgi:ABC-type bacteriocin/lantibiotic exporter with double-glycine peptidase domain
MVLDSYGHTGEETEERHLRQLCESDGTGTIAQNVVAAATHFGLFESSIKRPTFDELREDLSRGKWPIVYLNLFGGRTTNSHAVVVVEILGDQVFVLDPDLDDPGERTFTVGDFELAWSRARYLTIIIE